MSEIPYFFRAIPDEFLTDAFIEDIIMMKLVRYIMKRVRYVEHEEIVNNNRTQKKVKLKPYEWIYGRDMASKECGTTHNIIRKRINQQLLQGLIQKCTSSCTSSYTVYAIIPTAFKQNNNQQFNQQFNQQLHHNEETKTKRDKKNVRDIKDVSEPVGKVHNLVRCDSSFQNTNSFPAEPSLDRLMKQIEEYQFPDKTFIQSKTLSRWFKHYESQEIWDSIIYYEKMNEKKLVPKPEAYLEKTLQNRWWEMDKLRTEAKEREKKYATVKIKGEYK